MILFVLICGIVVGIGLTLCGVCIFALCRSAKQADLCRMPDQSPFEPK